MTKDEIIRMAREAGFVGFDGENKRLREFAALVAAAEREACAQLVERNAEVCADNSMLKDVLEGNAAAIRARGEE